MGTNYYIEKDKCVTCGHSEQAIHLGKSSGGWKFSFQYNGGNYYHNIKEMKLFTADKVITNEYGEIISDKAFWEMVDLKQVSKNLSHAEEYRSDSERVIDGYSFSDGEFC